MTGDAFRAYVEQAPAPVLRPGHVVAMDNLAAHKVMGVREATQAAGASILYLPELNPIEQAFAKLNAALRGGGARTRDAVWISIGQLLDPFTLDECRNYLGNPGSGRCS
jgi:transposase